MSYKKIIVGLVSSLLMSSYALESSAIQVTVTSASKEISALGFTVKGKKYGGLGSSYESKDVPKGNYKFGVRAGKDVGCTTSDGKKTVKLTKNTTADLQYDGKKCKMNISSN